MMTNQERFSRRVRGLDIEPHPELENVEKQWSERRRSPVKNKEEEGTEGQGGSMGTSNEEALEIKNTTSPRVTTRALFTKKSFTVSSKKPKKKEVWSYTKRKRFRKFGRYSLPSVKSQLNKRFLVKKSAEKDSESSQSKPLQVDVTEPEENKSSSKSPPILAQMSPSRPVKVLSPRRLSDVSDKKNTSEKISDLPIKTANQQTTAMEVDSGISSSVDSNGDSLDSVEQAKQLEKQKVHVLAMEEEEENSTVKGMVVKSCCLSETKCYIRKKSYPFDIHVPDNLTVILCVYRASSAGP